VLTVPHFPLHIFSHCTCSYIDTSATLGRMLLLQESLSTEASTVLDKSTPTQKKERATADKA